MGDPISSIKINMMGYMSARFKNILNEWQFFFCFINKLISANNSIHEWKFPIQNLPYTTKPETGHTAAKPKKNRASRINVLIIITRSSKALYKTEAVRMPFSQSGNRKCRRFKNTVIEGDLSDQIGHWWDWGK